MAPVTLATVALLAALAVPSPTSPVRRPTSGPAAPVPADAASAPGEAAEAEAVGPGPSGAFADDWAGALAAAKARRRPILVEIWAPW